MKPLIQHVSDTAIWVAFCRAQESSRPDALVRDPLAKALVGDRGQAMADQMPELIPVMERWMGVRTAVIDELILHAVDQGCDTVLNLAAGLDTRPYRLPLDSSIRWFEADFPRLIQHKETILRHEKPHCQLKRQALDLEISRNRQILLDQVIQDAKRALVLTEGLLMYWDPRTVRELACDLAERPAFQFWITDLISPWGLEHMRDDFKAHLGPVEASLRFAPSDGPRFFESCGWKVSEVRSAAQEAKRLLGQSEAEIFEQWHLFADGDPTQLTEHYRFVLLKR